MVPSFFCFNNNISKSFCFFDEDFLFMNILIISDNITLAEKWKDSLLTVRNKSDIIIVRLSKAQKHLDNKENPDIIFLETDEEEDLYISEEVNCPSPLVIISTNADLCLKAFDLNTFDYLIKPISVEDFEHSIKKHTKFYSKQVESEFIGDLHSLIKFVSTKEKEFKKRFMIKIGNTIKSISVKDIAYFYSYDKINYLMKIEGKKFPVENSLDEIEQMLNPENFYRANRQFIVNINAINEIHPYFKGRIKINLLPLQEGDIIISSEKSRKFKDWLNK